MRIRGLLFGVLISRGRAVLKQQSLEFDFFNNSRFALSSAQDESGFFEIAGNTQLEGQVLLPTVLTLFRDQREESPSIIYIHPGF